MTIYAKCPKDVADNVGPYLTIGKEYEAWPTDFGTDDLFHLCDDDGEQRICAWKNCAHIGGADWERIEREEED